MPEPSPSSPLPPAQTLKLIGHVHRAFHRVADQQLREQGFALGQLPVLMALKDGQPRSQAELARLAHVEQPSMAQLLNRMERDGLVERLPDPDDGRSRLISLTPACRARMPKSRAVMEALSEQALAGFSADDVALLGTLMRRLADNVEQMLAQGGL
jgi:DNA-binding MarR family transcriptional regulator